MKIAFITSLFGKSDRLGEFKRVDDYDYFLFTDKEGKKNLDTNWDVYDISNNVNICNLNCNIRKSRYPKFMGWELLSSMGLNYDCIYYCDAYLSPKPNVDWNKFSEFFVNEKFPFAQDKHCHPQVVKLGIIRELELIKSCRKDSQENIDKTLNFFKTNFPSINLNANQYFENTLFGYNPISDAVKNITKEFWSIYTSNDITFRDQPLWNLLLLKNKLIPNYQFHTKERFGCTGKYGNHTYA